MHIVENFWTTITCIFNFLTLSPDNGHGTIQRPLPDDLTIGDVTGVALSKGPIFKPPSAHPGSSFTCDYSHMIGWQACSSSEDRTCWLKHPDGRRYDIHKNYEVDGPTGITRNYTLVLTDTKINADGVLFEEAKVFNDQFPGPWLQACWGDRLNITVVNKLQHNGTSVHWHGIRQLFSNPMDGVNGVTQCAIAPGHSFSYIWNATQYGSTWYHSHYSSQYADGVQGPITIHGPTSAPFDEAINPAIMTDWGHNSAFAAEFRLNGLEKPSILLNGKGNVTRYSGIRSELPIPSPHEVIFQPKTKTGLSRAKRYLLRLINTSFDTTYIFTIDNHKLQVTTADFVPIKPYTTSSVLIGIGQRYNVIVIADPQRGNSNPIPRDGNFWIRTYEANDCNFIATNPVVGYERAGILRYNPSSPSTPTSQPWTDIQLGCADEPYQSLIPIVPWQVGEQANGLEKFNVGIGPPVPGFPLALFSFQPVTSPPTPLAPLKVDYGDPTVLHLVQSPNFMPPQWVVIPENYESEDWVYLVIAGNSDGSLNTFGNHPIHLHGHDFVVLQQEANMPFNNEAFKPKYDNLPRRDVALLPANEFLVIAFKTDNPGVWLVHCHIARHASGGLALQILERQADAYNLFGKPSSPGFNGISRVCKNWKSWVSNCNNWWSGCDPNGAFQSDSGI